VKLAYALALVLLAAALAAAEPQAQLLIVAREYPTGRPLGGVSLNVTVWVDGRTLAFNVNRTNPVGIWVGQLGVAPREAYLLAVSSGPANFTGFSRPQPSLPVRVADTLIEEVDYRAAFQPRANVTAISELRIPLQVVREANASVVRCAIWLAPARVVNVSALDPVTRRPVRLTVKPGVPLAPRGYLVSYLVPINYPALVTADTTLAEARRLRFWVSNDTRLIPWSYYAAEAFLSNQLSVIDDALRQLEAIGYPTEELRRDASMLRAIAQQALFFFERGNYTSAVGALLSLVSGVNALKSRVDGLFSYSQFAALGIIILTLAFAHTFSMLLFERGRALYASRLALLMALLLVATLTSPTMRLAAAGLLGALGVPLAALDVPSLAAGVLAMGFLAYAIFMLISLAAGPVRGFWLYLAIRYMKSKRLRTVLVLTTMTLVVASTLAVSGVALGASTVVRTSAGAGSTASTSRSTPSAGPTASTPPRSSGSRCCSTPPTWGGWPPSRPPTSGSW